MGIVIGLVCGWIALMAKDAVVDSSQALRGKEPATLVRFRTRHKEKQQKQELKLGKTAGPIKKYIRALEDNCAAKQIDKSNRKLEAHRRWVEAHRDEHDQHWIDKWDKKLEKRRDRLARWGQRRGVIEQLPGEGTDSGDAAGEGASTEEWAAVNSTATHEKVRLDAEPKPETTQDESTAQDDGAETKPESAPGPAPLIAAAVAPTSPGGSMHYQDYVAARREDAEETRALAGELVAAADALSGRGFGTAITEALTEAAGPVTASAGHIDAAADAVQTEGDRLRDAYERAPDVPDEAALVR